MSERDSSTVEIAIDYIKERIESPFLMSFLVSWAIVNRDFVFYLFLAESKDKYRTLADWDFSSFVLGWYSPVGDSFIYPLFFGALITLFFSAISMSFSGARYSVTSFFKGFAQTQKSKYDNILEITKAKLQLEILTTDVHALQSKRDIILKGLTEETAAFERVKSSTYTHDRYKIYEFISQFTSFHLSYLPDLVEYNWIVAEKISPNCKVKISCHLAGYNTKQFLKSSMFSGFFAEFLLLRDYFDIDIDNEASSISRLLNEFINVEFGMDTKEGRAVFKILEITVPERLG